MPLNLHEPKARVEPGFAQMGEAKRFTKLVKLLIRRRNQIYAKVR